MSRPRRWHGEEGQVFPALLLVVVVLLFGGFALGQLGSASDQHGQTQTVADAAAVAAAHEVLADGIRRALPGTPPVLLAKLDLQPLVRNPSSAGCEAARRNWNANRHRSELGCGALSWSYGPADAAVRVQAPEGEIVTGPAADTRGQPTVATATARVRFWRCPNGYGQLGNSLLGALVDTVTKELGQRDPGCGPAGGVGPIFNPPPLPEVTPPPMPAAPPAPAPSPSAPLPVPDLSGLPGGAAAYDAIARSFRVEIVN